MIAKLILSFFLLKLAASDPIAFKDCGSTGKDVKVDVSGCSKFPCILNKGQDYTIQLNFTSTSSSQKVSNKIFGVIAGIPVPFPFPQQDACQTGILCPMQSGSSFSDEITLSVLTSYPSLSLFVKFEIVDDASKTVVCALFPAQIKG